MEKEVAEKTLDDILSFILDEAKKDYESSELYKLFLENKSNVSQTAEQLIHRWDKDMLIAFHHLEKNMKVDIQYKDLFRMFNNMMKILEESHKKRFERFNE